MKHFTGTRVRKIAAIVLVYVSTLLCVIVAGEKVPFSMMITAGNPGGSRRMAEKKKTNDEDCISMEECTMCTFSDQKVIPACQETGRFQKFQCGKPNSEAEKNTQYRSCKYTKADEEFAVIRMQMICLVVGSMAFMRVRKEKKLSASLFEQRKLEQEQLKNSIMEKRRFGASNNNNSEEEIEFSLMTNQETVPLVRTNSSGRLDGLVRTNSSSRLEVI